MAEYARLDFNVASWNIHSAIGRDGRYHPERVAQLIDQMDLDLVGLQEVSLSGSYADEALLQTLSPTFAYWHFVPTHVQYPRYRSNRPAGFGNLLLSRWPICIHNHLDLSFMHHEPRCKLVCEVATPVGNLWVWVTHFGLRYQERKRQANWVAAALAQLDPQTPLLLMGDFNDWMPGTPSLRALRSSLGRPATRRTFPAAFPVFALDQFWVHGPLCVRKIQAVKENGIGLASDHLPLRGVLQLTLPHKAVADKRAERPDKDKGFCNPEVNRQQWVPGFN